MNRFIAYISELRKLNIESRQIYQHYYQLSESQMSNSCFLHRICWNEGFDYYYMVMNDYLCIVADDNAINSAHLVFPLGKDYSSSLFKEVVFYWMDIFRKLKIPFRIEFIDDATKKIIENLFQEEGIGIRVSEETDCFDYVYKLEDILCIHGRKNRFKRSMLNQLGSQRYSIIRIDKNSKEKYRCLELNRLWLEWKKREQHKEDFDECALNFFWDNIEELEFVCYALTINGVIQAYFIASINNDLLTFHFAKSNRLYRYASFALQHIYLQSLLPDGIKYINHEDDMGDAGLKYYKQHLGKYTSLRKYSLVVM